jgi:hypothetical protein
MPENNVYLIPVRNADGAVKRVADPIGGGFLPADGAYKDLYNYYWLRRLQAGDVVRGTPPGGEPLPAAMPASPGSLL